MKQAPLAEHAWRGLGVVWIWLPIRQRIVDPFPFFYRSQL